MKGFSSRQWNTVRRKINTEWRRDFLIEEGPWYNFKMDQIQNMLGGDNMPQGAPQESADSFGQEMSQDEMRSNLSDLMAQIEAKYQDFNSAKFSADNKNADANAQALKGVFDMFENLGVDPEDPAQLQTFFDNLRERSPEIADQVEKAIQSIVEGANPPQDGMNSEVAEQMPVEDPMGGAMPEGAPQDINMNQNANLQQGL